MGTPGLSQTSLFGTTKLSEDNTSYEQLKSTIRLITPTDRSDSSLHILVHHPMFGAREVPCDRNHISWEQFRDTAVRHFPGILNPDDYVLFSLRSRINSGTDQIAGSLRAIHALNLV